MDTFQVKFCSPKIVAKFFGLATFFSTFTTILVIGLTFVGIIEQLSELTTSTDKVTAFIGKRFATTGTLLFATISSLINGIFGFLIGYCVGIFYNSFLASSKPFIIYSNMALIKSVPKKENSLS